MRNLKQQLPVGRGGAIGEIADLLDAAARDLTAAGVTLPGKVAFETTENGIVDNSTMDDAMCRRAMITYARMLFRSPDDYERLREAYNAQKVILMHATGYTDFQNGDGTYATGQAF